MRTLPVLDLPSDPRACGQGHGEHFRDAIRQAVGTWQDSLSQYVDDVPGLLQTVGGNAGFSDAVSRWTPWLNDEVAGLAEGAGVEPGVMFAYQLVDEVWAQLRLLRRPRAEQLEHCSTLSVPGERRSFVGQNLDLPAWYDGTLAVLRIAGSGERPSAAVVSSVGLVGMTGINGDGVAVAVNAMPDLPSAPVGLPVAFVVRGALGLRSTEQARGWLTTITHATGQTYLVGDRSGTALLECGPDGVDECPAEDVLVHTNHSRLRTRTEEQHQARLESVERLAFLTDQAPTVTGPTDVLRVLDDSILRRSAEAGDGNVTCATVLYDCGDLPSLLVRGGPETSAFARLEPPRVPAPPALALRGSERQVPTSQGTVTVHDNGGTGPSVLLLHGMTRTLADWLPVVRLLPERFRAVAVDFPGHGRSDQVETWHWRDQLGLVDELIDALDLGPTVVVGHSLGGLIGSVLAAESDGVRAVINVDGHGAGLPGQFEGLSAETVADGLALMQKMSLDSLAQATDHLPEALKEQEVAEMTTLLTSLPLHPEDVAAVAGRPYAPAGDDLVRRSPAPATNADIYRSLSELDAEDHARRSRVPMVILRTATGGDDDPSLDPLLAQMLQAFNRTADARLEELAASRDDVRVECWPCGHAVNLEAPDHLAALITGFVDGLPD